MFLFGTGRNGKSVFVNTITGILNEYAVTAAMETCTASKFERHSTDLAMLRGARVVTATETERNQAWAESRIKLLTGGDPITARHMRQDPFTFRPMFKLIIAANQQPRLRSVDEGVRRRFNIVPFAYVPEKPDMLLEAKLVEEWSGILRWMIEGCLDWQRNGLLRPARVTEETESYLDQQDVLGEWIDGECTTGPQHKATTEQLYRSWAQFAALRGEAPGTSQALGLMLKTRGFQSDKNIPKFDGGYARGFRGIAVSGNQ